MKTNFKCMLLFLMMIMAATVSNAQNHDLTPAPPDDAGEGDPEDCVRIYNGRSETFFLGIGPWPYYLPKYTICLEYQFYCEFRVNGVVVDSKLYPNIIYDCTVTYGSILEPKGIKVNEFDVLLKVMKETPAYASLRIPTRL